MRPQERRRDLIIAGIAAIYTMFMIYAGGLKFILLSAVLYAPGTVLYFWARREQGKPVFTASRTGSSSACAVGGAVIGIYGLVTGCHHHLSTEHIKAQAPWQVIRMTFGVHSEVGQLRKVMVCAPGRAHQRLTPSNCDELLFDDVLWVDNAKRDHFDFMHQDARSRHRGGRDAQPAGRDGGDARGQEVDPRQPGRAQPGGPRPRRRDRSYLEASTPAISPRP